MSTVFPGLMTWNFLSSSGKGNELSERSVGQHHAAVQSP